MASASGELLYRMNSTELLSIAADGGAGNARSKARAQGLLRLSNDIERFRMNERPADADVNGRARETLIRSRPRTSASDGALKFEVLPPRLDMATLANSATGALTVTNTSLLSMRLLVKSDSDRVTTKKPFGIIAPGMSATVSVTAHQYGQDERRVQAMRGDDNASTLTERTALEATVEVTGVTSNGARATCAIPVALLDGRRAVVDKSNDASCFTESDILAATGRTSLGGGGGDGETTITFNDEVTVLTADS